MSILRAPYPAHNCSSSSSGSASRRLREAISPACPLANPTIPSNLAAIDLPPPPQPPRHPFPIPNTVHITILYVDVRGPAGVPVCRCAGVPVTVRFLVSTTTRLEILPECSAVQMFPTLSFILERNQICAGHFHPEARAVSSSTHIQYSNTAIANCGVPWPTFGFQTNVDTACRQKIKQTDLKVKDILEHQKKIPHIARK
jgi:hypothetical protein